MKLLAFFLHILLSIACFGQCSPEDVPTVKKHMDGPLGSDLSLVERHFPMMTTISERLPIVAISDSAVLLALDSAIGRTTGPYLFSDGTCAFVRIFERRSEQWARVNYILVSISNDDEAAEERADSLLLSIRDGMPFTSAAILYSKAGDVSRNGGDLGWFTLSSQMPEFSSAVLRHKKGDVYKVFVPAYGWYVVQVIEEARTCSGLAYLVGRAPFPK
jgi:hypothetical protein